MEPRKGRDRLSSHHTPSRQWRHRPQGTAVHIPYNKWRVGGTAESLARATQNPDTALAGWSFFSHVPVHGSNSPRSWLCPLDAWFCFLSFCFSWKPECVCSCVVVSACFLPVELWGSSGPLSFCTISVPFSPSQSCFCWHYTLKGCVGLPWVSLGFIPLDKSHTHKYLLNRPCAA